MGFETLDWVRCYEVARRVALLCGLMFFGLAAAAQSEPAPEPTEAEGEAVGDGEGDGAAEGEEEAPSLPWQPGPRPIDLGHEYQARPAHRICVPGSARGRPGDGEDGQPAQRGRARPGVRRREESPWLHGTELRREGYVKDDEAIDCRRPARLDRATAIDRAQRRAQGARLQARSSSTAGTSSRTTTRPRTTWCGASRSSDADGASANYNTRILGRKGYVSLNLVTDPARVPSDKQHAGALLAADALSSRARATRTSWPRPTRSPSTAWPAWSPVAWASAR